MNYIIASLYAVGILLLFVLARRSLDKPITLCLTLTNAGWLIYSLTSRIYRIVNDTNDVSTIYNNAALVLFTLATIAFFALALRFDARIKAGRAFTGPDGRRWGVREARLPTGHAVNIAQPVSILHMQLRAHEAAQRAETEADEQAAPLRQRTGG